MIHKYTNSSFPTFSFYLLQLFQCYPSLCHMPATYSILKQVQYETILSDQNSLEGGAGAGGRMGGYFERIGLKEERRKRVTSSQEPLPCTSFFLKLCEIFFPRHLSIFFSSCTSRPCLLIFSILRPLRHLLGLHPLAKRRTYWLS